MKFPHELAAASLNEEVMPKTRGRKKRGRRPMNSDGKGAKCSYCKRQLQRTTAKSKTAATRDHVKPKSRGGTGRVWCCLQCNGLKADMEPKTWRKFMADNPEWWKDPYAQEKAKAAANSERKSLVQRQEQ